MSQLPPFPGTRFYYNLKRCSTDKLLTRSRLTALFPEETSCYGLTISVCVCVSQFYQLFGHLAVPEHSA